MLHFQVWPFHEYSWVRISRIDFLPVHGHGWSDGIIWHKFPERLLPFVGSLYCKHLSPFLLAKKLKKIIVRVLNSVFLVSHVRHAPCTRPASHIQALSFFISSQPDFIVLFGPRVAHQQSVHLSKLCVPRDSHRAPSNTFLCVPCGGLIHVRL